MLKTSAEGVQTSEIWQCCQNALLEAMWKMGFDKAEKWYIHKPEKVLESEDCKILWDFPIQTDKTLEYNPLDITVTDKKSKKCLLIDPACPFDTRIEKKEERMMHKLQWVEVWNCKNLENEKGRSYTDRNRGIRNSNKTLWETDREIRLGLNDCSITETLFTWNGENNTESAGCEVRIRKKKLQYLRQQVRVRYFGMVR